MTIDRLDQPEITKDFLRQLPLFTGLGEDDLEHLLQSAEHVSLDEGQTIITEGEPGDAMYIVLRGELQVTKRSGQEDVILATHGPGQFVGEMALVDQGPRSASVSALGPTLLLRITQPSFERLLGSCPAAARSILKTVMRRLQSTELMLIQHQKLASLGTLAAGLAHELNNPAAALRRSVQSLGNEIHRWQELTDSIARLELTSEQSALIEHLRETAWQNTGSTAMLDPLSRGDRELDVETALTDRGVENGWEIAPTLVTCGWDADTVERLGALFSGQSLTAVTNWIAAEYSIATLLDELRRSGSAISEIVAAVKTYSHLDQAPIQDVDVRKGLENTLIMLRHKLDHVRVVRDYADDLPLIEAYASELNQVWTNIIDNAIDAMDGDGELVLRTRRENDAVVVEISDTGPGIPREIQPRIFDPFFTTKAPGVGTGLGLHVSYNIIVHKHRGQIQVASRPGLTTFQVSLPIRLRQAGARSPELNGDAAGHD